MFLLINSQIYSKVMFSTQPLSSMDMTALLLYAGGLDFATKRAWPVGVRK